VLVDRTGVIVWRDMEAFSTATIAQATANTELEPDLKDGESTAGKPLTLRMAEKQELPPELAAHAAAAANGTAPPPPGHQFGQQPPPAAPGDNAQAKKAAAAAPDADEDPGQVAKGGKAKRETWVIESARLYNRRLARALAELPTGRDRAA
jgi:hypothetical protein